MGTDIEQPDYKKHAVAPSDLTDGFAASIERVMEFVMARERWVVEKPGCERVGLNDIERVLLEVFQLRSGENDGTIF